MYNVRKMKIGKTVQMDVLAQASGTLYRQTVIWFWRCVRRKEKWLSPAALMRWHNSKKLHAPFGNPVVGVMASPIGVRYRPNMRCSSGGLLYAS